MLGNTVRRPYAPEEIASWKESWSRPGAVSGMLGWYRAAVRWPAVPRARRVTVPTQIVFGKEDRALDWRMAEGSAALCDDVRLELIEGAGHFVQHDVPERVNAILREFLASQRGATGTGSADGVS
jgi:pimeloyl-ACP methyl ester carboxylesterase